MQTILSSSSSTGNPVRDYRLRALGGIEPPPSSQSVSPLSPPTKTYDISTSWFSSRHLVIKENRKQMFCTEAKLALFKSKPFVSIHKETSRGPVVCSAKLDSKSSFRICLGSPDRADYQERFVYEGETYGCLAYKFSSPFQPRYFATYAYAWKRTKDRELSVPLSPSIEPGPVATVWTSRKDWKLIQVPRQRHTEAKEFVEPDPRRKVLAVFVHDTSWLSLRRRGGIHWLADLPRETEVWSLATLMGLLERERRSMWDVWNGNYPL